MSVHELIKKRKTTTASVPAFSPPTVAQPRAAADRHALRFGSVAAAACCFLRLHDAASLIRDSEPGRSNNKSVGACSSVVRGRYALARALAPAPGPAYPRSMAKRKLTARATGKVTHLRVISTPARAPAGRSMEIELFSARIG